MHWRPSHRFGKRAAAIADRHYNRQKVGSNQFVPPGSCMVLLTENADAVWVTSWQLPQFVKHAWPGAWVNSCFRNESQVLSSDLIREAVAATLGYYGPAPERGMITFIDLSKVRHKRDPGRCYRKAGFKPAGYTKGGLLCLQLMPEEMPEPMFVFPDQGLLAF
jgi:hypothetical protein